MLKRKFGKTGMEVSAVGMGTWNIGNQWGELDDHQVLDTILAAYHSGITVFDTRRRLRHSRRMLGRTGSAGRWTESAKMSC